MSGVKLRVLKTTVISGSDAETLSEELNTFFASFRDSEGELVDVFYVASFQVLVIYTG